MGERRVRNAEVEGSIPFHSTTIQRIHRPTLRRPYKPALDHAAAGSSILAGDSKSRPTHFDPAVLAAFKVAIADFRDIFETLRD